MELNEAVDPHNSQLTFQLLRMVGCLDFRVFWPIYVTRTGNRLIFPRNLNCILFAEFAINGV